MTTSNQINCVAKAENRRLCCIIIELHTLTEIERKEDKREDALRERREKQDRGSEENTGYIGGTEDLFLWLILSWSLILPLI